MMNNSHYVGKAWVKSQDSIQTCKPKKYKVSVLQKNCASYDKATFLSETIEMECVHQTYQLQG